MDDFPPDSGLGRHGRELLAPLLALRDPQARLTWLVEQARRRPMLPDWLRIEAHRVHGCAVRLWLVAEFRDGRCWFRTDSDAASLKAVIGLLCDIYSGATPDEIAACPAGFLERLGLLRHLAENRRATIRRVADAIRQFALQHRTTSPAPDAESSAPCLPRSG